MKDSTTISQSLEVLAEQKLERTLKGIYLKHSGYFGFPIIAIGIFIEFVALQIEADNKSDYIFIFKNLNRASLK